MNQTLYINIGDGNAYELTVDDFNFHPVLRDVENVILFFLLSNRALTLFDTQKILLADEVFSPYIKKYNQLVGINFIKNEDSNEYIATLNIQSQMIFLGKAIATLLFDYIRASDYNSKLKNTSKMRFLRHIRNGAAHNNCFNLIDEDGNWKISEKKPIVWHNKKIERSLQGRQIFTQFVSLNDMILLASEFSKELLAIDSKP